MTAEEAQADLQAYLDKHNVQPRLNELINGLMHAKPEMPFQWMAEQLEGSPGHAAGGGRTAPSAEVAATDPAITGLVDAWGTAMAFQPGGSSASAVPAASTGAAAGAAGGAGAGAPSDKEAKKAAKAEEKRRKEEEKERRRKERDEAERRKAEGPDAPNVTLNDFMSHPFGNLMIQSHGKTERVWSSVGELEPGMKGQCVWLRARLHNSRKQSAKLGFIVLRHRLYTVQAVVVGKEMAGFVCSLPKESVVDVFAEVTVPPEPVSSCTQSGIELGVQRVYCVSRAASRLPLQLEDAARTEEELERLNLPRVDQSTRLDNRVIDMRTQANQGIMRIQSAVCDLFRSFLLERGFVEIHSPKMIATASEGGADVFRLGYFNRHAYLAQSPQLYKQMALMADLGKVFEIGPVFRSEKSHTHRHMTEFTGLDMEMTFKDHYSEVLDVLEALFLHIFDGLNARCASEIAAVKAQYPFADLKYSRPALRLTFAEACALLREHGPAIGAEQLTALEAKQRAAATAGDDEKSREIAQLIADTKAHLETVPTHADDADLSTKDEKLLGIVMHRHRGVDFYVVDKFPSALRPFYTMHDPDDPAVSNSYDIFIRGEEVTSGAQRIHDPAMLLANGKRLGVDLAPIQDYVDSFQYGAMPHAGGGIGLERVVMLFLALDNIRKSSMFPRDPSRLTP